MTKAKWIVFPILILLLAGWWMWPWSMEPEQPTAISVDRLRVITYNVQLLPLRRLNKRPNAAYRAAEQVKRLAVYDIVGLNEVFAADRRTQIIDSLKKAWGPEFQCVTSREEDRSVLGLDSGLVLATRLPIVESHTLVFGNDSRMLEGGVFGDGFCSKGALHARLERSCAGGEDILIDCFVTHLESVDPARREEQYNKLAQFMREHSGSDNPVILLGDLNTVGDRNEMNDPKSQYRRMWSALVAARPNWIDLGRLIDASQQGTSDPEAPTGGQRIDYILISNGPHAEQLRPVRAKTHPFPDPHVKFLSDHCAVEADFELAANTHLNE